jgi:hypothetical protein
MYLQEDEPVWCVVQTYSRYYHVLLCCHVQVHAASWVVSRGCTPSRMQRCLLSVRRCLHPSCRAGLGQRSSWEHHHPS